MSKKPNTSLLFEQMRSFASLARTLNLSQTVRELDSTRQTVRRHIALLEEAKGEALFRVVNRVYQLTEAGERSLREAEELIARGEAWLAGESGHIGGLYHLSLETDGNLSYYLQQHALGRMWEASSDLLATGMQTWAHARGRIEDESFKPIRPYLMIFRKLASDWICVEVGNRSSYATWYGWSWERSSVGRGLADLPGGPGFANLLSQPFQDTMVTQGVRLDHIHTQIPKDDHNELVPITYERLLMGCFFPDGSPAIGALINRTHDVAIEGLPAGQAESMPKELIMQFDTPNR